MLASTGKTAEAFFCLVWVNKVKKCRCARQLQYPVSRICQVVRAVFFIREMLYAAYEHNVEFAPDDRFFAALLP